MTPLVWCILLLALGLALIFLEMFIPSAGVLSGLAAVAIITSIVLAYVNCGLATGTIFTIVGVILVPACIGLALRFYPQTPFGRRILAIPPTPEQVAPAYDRSPDGRLLKGQIGKARTPLLPGGSIKIEGKSYDALSEGEPIDAGEIVQVIRAEGKHLVVRRVEGDLPHVAKSDAPGRVETPTLESLGIDPFDDPLG